MNYPSKITSHTLVKNGADYIEMALSSVKDFVEKMIVYDTGSTDGTQDIIRKLIKKGWNIKFREFGPFKGSWETGIPELTNLRNLMFDETDTEWSLVIDDDEVYYKKTMEEMQTILSSGLADIAKLKVLAIAIPFYDFAKDCSHVWADNNISPANRLVRTKEVRFRGDWPHEMWFVKNEQAWLNKFKDPRVGRLKNPFCHFGRLKSRDNVARRPEEDVRTTPFIGKLPEVME